MAISIGGQHTRECRDAMMRNWREHEATTGHELNTLETIAWMLGNWPWENPWQRTELWDIGCGPCRAKRFFPHANYHGIDAEESWKEVIDPSIDFRVGSVYQTGLPDDSCELVLCNEVLFHVCAWNAAVRELWRITRDRLVFSTYFDTRLTARIPLIGKHRGAQATLVENKATGNQWFSVHNIVPPWMIKRFVARELKPRAVRYLWTRPAQGKSRNQGFAYVMMDK